MCVRREFFSRGHLIEAYANNDFDRFFSAPFVITVPYRAIFVFVIFHPSYLFSTPFAIVTFITPKLNSARSEVYNTADAFHRSQELILPVSRGRSVGNPVVELRLARCANNNVSYSSGESGAGGENGSRAPEIRRLPPASVSFSRSPAGSLAGSFGASRPVNSDRLRERRCSPRPRHVSVIRHFRTGMPAATV